jgi:allantoinase
VHLNQPGRTHWEGFATGTLAAISGGVTTLIDMPLNSIPPTTTKQHLEIKRQSAKECGVFSDVGFWGGIIPGNAGDLKGLLDEGVKGFKCFLIESGVDVSQTLRVACRALMSRSSHV